MTIVRTDSPHRIVKHYGPGSHPSGTSQAVHGGEGGEPVWNPPQRGKTSWYWADVLDLDEERLRSAITDKLEIVPGSLKVNPRTRAPESGFTKGESFQFQAKSQGRDYFFDVGRSNVNGKLAPGSGSITVSYRPLPSLSERIAGSMLWGINRPNVVTKVTVAGADRRRGVATAMLQAARLIDPELAHSTDLSESGAAWAEVVKHYGPGPHPSGTSQQAHAGSRIGPFNRALHGVENSMAAIKAIDPALPDRVMASWEKNSDGASRRTIRDRYIRLVEAAKKSGNFEAGLTWYFDQHNDLTELAAQYDQWELQDMAAAAAALSPQTEWNANLRYTVEMAAYLDRDEIYGLSDEQLATLNEKLAAVGFPPTKNGIKLSSLDAKSAILAMFAMSDNLHEDKGGWGAGAGFSPFIDAVEIFRGASPEILRGVKTRSFYNLLWDPNNDVDVTIDFQMMDAAAWRVHDKNENSGLNGTPTKQIDGIKTSIGVRPFLGDIVRSVATKYGITPSQAQAIIWLEWKDTVK